MSPWKKLLRGVTTPGPLFVVPAPMVMGSTLPVPPDVVPRPPLYVFVSTRFPSRYRAMPREPKLNDAWCHCPAVTALGEFTVLLLPTLCRRVRRVPSFSFGSRGMALYLDGLSVSIFSSAK